MSVVERFAASVRGQPAELAGPQLLPVRLARAAVRVLPGVAGAGISVLADPGMRVPLGASDDDAATAERLQFTVGEGPCLLAHSSARPVYAPAAVFAARWPLLYEELTARTPYRAVLAVPLRYRFTGFGALDLYLCGDDPIPPVTGYDAYAVGNEVVAALTGPDGVDRATRPYGYTDPGWLDSPAARRRQLVWAAVGMLSVHLDLPAPAALDVLRAAACSRGQLIDDLAEDLVSRRLPITDLRF